MAYSQQRIIGRNPFVLPPQTPGLLGRNDAADPDYGICLVGDSQGPLGTNHDHGDPNIPAKVIKPAVEDDPTLELTQRSFSTPKNETPYITFVVEVTFSPVLVKGQSNNKIKVDLEKKAVEYEHELRKIGDDISAKVSAKLNGPKALEGLVKTIVEGDPKYLLEAVELKLGADIKLGEHVSVTPSFSISDYPIQFAVKWTMPWMPNYSASHQVNWRIALTIKMRPGLKASSELLKRLGGKFIEFVNVYCRAYMLELISTGVITAAAIGAAAAALTFGFVSLFSYAIDKQAKAGALLAYCITYAEAYVFYLYGRNHLGQSKLASSDESSDPQLINGTRSQANNDVMNDVRQLAATMSPGTPWSDGFMKEMFRANYMESRKQKDEFVARQTMYQDILGKLKTKYGV